ncbi:MAG: hypothetical protein JXR48_06695 [Candidatus Delongbacteria bacterium]|nr:hypothetical protein [Candidatus Delongbacteria bacterium]MBN2834639.1 hypothetical protein [Candidatus Delongbacteria bacterium]
MIKLMVVIMLLIQVASYAQDKMSGSAFIGASNIGGKNYQQIGFRADLPMGKFGFGLDVKINIDDDGDIREEDWDDFQDYFDLIYYVRYGKKGEPFYARVGGLDYTRIGYGILVDGYSNMIDYPSKKMIGLESSFVMERFFGELFINDFKEVFEDKSSIVFAARAGYEVLSGFRFSGTIAADLNQYNGLHDSDDDGVPDQIDKYPENDKYATDLDFYKDKISQDAIDELISAGLIDPTESDQLFSKDKQTAEVVLYGGDVSYPLFQTEFVKLDVYSQIAFIQDNGFGFSAPALFANFGPIRLSAEYRQTDGDFLFGFFNNTYELERASFIGGGSAVITKSDRLEGIPSFKGYFAGASFDVFEFVTCNVSYEDMRSSDLDLKSLRGEILLTDKLIPKISKAKAYYVQNNVEDFKTLKSPRTVYGFVFGYEIASGVSLDYNWRTTFVDKNGDFEIKGENEEVNTYSISATMVF